MEVEPIRKFAGASASHPLVHCGSNEVHLIIGGMGPRNAAKKAEAALRVMTDASVAPKPDAVLVIGLCGGLTESLPESRVVAYTACGLTEASKPLLQCSENIVDSLISLLSSSGVRCDRTVGITSPHIATNRVERLALAKSGADVVDMGELRHLECCGAGVPAAVLRVVSDSMDRVLPDFNRALNDAGALDGAKASICAQRSDADGETPYREQASDAQFREGA